MDTDKVTGTLEVGINERGEVVVNHPGLEADENGVALSVTTLSYEEAVAVYLRARGILDDGAVSLGDPIPQDWEPKR